MFLLAVYPSLHGPSHPKPSQLVSDWVTVEVRSSDAARHHSSSLLNSPYLTYCRGVWGVIVLLENDGAHQMGWHVTNGVASKAAPQHLTSSSTFHSVIRVHQPVHPFYVHRDAC